MGGPGGAPLVDCEVTDRKEDVASLRLRGQLVGDVPSDLLKRSLERHFVDDGVSVIRVDLGGLSEMSLEGVGILLELWSESLRRGKRLVVHDARGPVRDKLVTTGVLGMLQGWE